MHGYPANGAHPLQIMQMAAGFASGGATVLLAYARRANTAAMRAVSDPFEYAGVRRTFALIGLPTVDAIKRVTIDWPVLNHGPIRLLAHLLQLWSFAVAALTVVRRWRPNVVYSRDLLPLTVLRLLMGQRACFCFEVHTVPRSRLSAALNCWAARRMDAVVAITEGLRRWYLEAGFEPERLFVAPDAVDIQAFANRDKAEARTELDIPARRASGLLSGPSVSLEGRRHSGGSVAIRRLGGAVDHRGRGSAGSGPDSHVRRQPAQRARLGTHAARPSATLPGRRRRSRGPVQRSPGHCARAHVAAQVVRIHGRGASDRGQ